MQIVPVIDLLDGQVVRAIRGDRASYRPVVSQLCAGSAPLDVARALLAHCASRTLYIADLNALTGRGPQCALLAALAESLSDVEIWLDGGFATPDAAAVALHAAGPNAHPVIASESLPDAGAIAGFTARWPEALLSLDRRQGQALGARDCWTDTRHWPARLIVMTLDRVGSFDGPELDTLAEVRARAAGRQLIGAGGIRDAADLDAARTAGAQAWLVASALHDGKLPAQLLSS